MADFTLIFIYMSMVSSHIVEGRIFSIVYHHCSVNVAIHWIHIVHSHYDDDYLYISNVKVQILHPENIYQYLFEKPHLLWSRKLLD